MLLGFTYPDKCDDIDWVYPDLSQNGRNVRDYLLAGGFLLMIFQLLAMICSLMKECSEYAAYICIFVTYISFLPISIAGLFYLFILTEMNINICYSLNGPKLKFETYLMELFGYFIYYLNLNSGIPLLVVSTNISQTF